MLPGHPTLVNCPHCGAPKYIESILSGNTMGQMIWSDTYRDFPMLPMPSRIMHCKHCGRYFFYEDARPTEEDAEEIDHLFSTYNPDQSDRKRAIRDEVDENGFGELSFQEADEAFRTLYSKRLRRKRRRLLLFTWLFKFNDEFGGRETFKDPSPEILAQREIVVKHIIRMCPFNRLLIAELHREMGHFKKCIAILRCFPLWPGLTKAFTARQIRAYAEADRSDVFRVKLWWESSLLH